LACSRAARAGPAARLPPAPDFVSGVLRIQKRVHPHAFVHKAAAEGSDLRTVRRRVGPEIIQRGFIEMRPVVQRRGDERRSDIAPDPLRQMADRPSSIRRFAAYYYTIDPMQSPYAGIRSQPVQGFRERRFSGGLRPGYAGAALLLCTASRHVFG